MDSLEKDDDLFKRLVEAIEVIADVNKKLSSEPVEVKAEGGPPICPKCHKLNPSIDLMGTFGGSGFFGEFFLQAKCLVCKTTFYALPDGWDVYLDRKEFTDMLQSRSKFFNALKEGNS